ncbi:MAG TPA: glycosyltransferase family 2 protein [Acetobacteraceae bacterium]|nr:glycosyltransferase family 2 protein [Acetobacteraceae bacterium]
MQDRPAPLLTVCVCTRDRPRYLVDCLAALRLQTVGPHRFEILVVDSASAPIAAGEMARLVAGMPNARLLRLERPGISFARNEGAAAARSDWIAYLDDDAIASADWAETILDVIARPAPPALFGGRILPLWEAPLPRWWPGRLIGVLSLIECAEAGEYRAPGMPKGLEPYAANMVVHRPALMAAGGFLDTIGRYGTALLSDEEVQLAWRLQGLGYSARHEPRLVVRHQVQAARLNPAWLMRRLFWQGASSVVTRRAVGEPGRVWRALPRRLAVAALFAPAALVPASSPRLIAVRWRLAYSVGFVRAALGWQPGRAARLQAAK